MNYLEIPFDVNYHISDALAVHGGVSYNRLINMTINKWNYETTYKKFNLNDFVKKDYSIRFGTSIDLNGMLITWNGSYGMMWVGKDGEPLGWRQGNNAFKNAAMDLMLTYPFKIKSKAWKRFHGK